MGNICKNNFKQVEETNSEVNYVKILKNIKQKIHLIINRFF